jgi:outer membrane protein TolC
MATKINSFAAFFLIFTVGSILLLALFSAPSVALPFRNGPLTTAQEEKLHPEAQSLLSELPDRTLTLEFIIHRASNFSATLKNISSNLALAEAVYFQGQAPLETRIYGGANTVKDQLESFNPFNYTQLKSNNYTIGASTSFQSGTQLGIQFAQSKTNIEYNNPTLPSSNTWETKASLTLQQSLWQNSFGTSTRKNIKSAELTKQSIVHAHQGAVEDWALGISQLYYSAWVAQEALRESDESVERRNRLAKITKIRAQRGTAEAPEELQIKSAVLSAQAMQKNSLQTISELWKHLVIAVGLPEHLLSVDPRLVPLNYIAPVQEAIDVCKTAIFNPESIADVKSAHFAKQAAEIKEESTKDLFNPQLSLIAGASTNGIDESFSPTMTELAKADHPSWNLGIQFSIPLEKSMEKAQVANAIAERMKSQAQSQFISEQSKIDWHNQCSNLDRLNSTTDLLKEVHDNHLKRVELEEKRFEVGRVAILNVIQAGDDATQAKLELANNIAQKNFTSWKILKLAGKLKDRMNFNNLSTIQK